MMVLYSPAINKEMSKMSLFKKGMFPNRLNININIERLFIFKLMTLRYVHHVHPGIFIPTHSSQHR